MKIVTVAEMVAMERATDAAGFSYDQMMAAAGGALAAVVQEKAAESATILCLIGPGNNGGDGLVACARLQRAGIAASAYIWRRKEGDDPLVAAVHNPLWASQDTDYAQLRRLTGEAGVIVDALLGTGNERPISGSLAALLAVVHEVLGERGAAEPSLIAPAQPDSGLGRRGSPLIIACDCPSGLNCDTGAIDPLALPADVTVTFALPKTGHYLQPGAVACGMLTIADIHIDRKLAPAHAPDLLTAGEVAALLPPRPPAGHKGTFGKALIVAGSASYPGAAALAALSAYRAGAGLVHLAASAEVGRLVAAHLPEPIHTVLPAERGALTVDGAAVLAPLLSGHEALLVGPGLGSAVATAELVEALLAGGVAGSQGLLFAASDMPPGPDLPPLVVDADGLNALARMEGGPASLPPGSILTPHPGEMSRLTGLSTAAINANRWDVARRYAALWNQIVILKGAFTVIAHPGGRLAISPFADAALATAGSGDVLAGVLVALLAQGANPWAAARGAVYLHALAGRLASQDLGPTLLATDIASALPQALASLQRMRSR